MQIPSQAWHFFSPKTLIWNLESVECEVWSGECGVWSVKGGLCGMCGMCECVTCKVWSVKCTV